MKKNALLLIGLLGFSLIQAQQKAVTETGEEVILYDDGTWSYINEYQLSKKDIPTNQNRFEKDYESTFLLKSSNFNVGFYLNPKLWSFKKAIDNPDVEYELQLKDKDLYGMIITERVEIPLKTLKSLAMDNAKSVSPDLKIIKEEYRYVNGIKVLLLQMDGSMDGVKFSYYGYYFSNTNGSVQFITYTSQNLLKSYKPDIEKLLNGLVELY